MLLTLPNIISFLRIPLAFLFLQENPVWRLWAIILAMLSDGLDGYLARRNKMTSQIGTLLDPIADKFFVLFVASILIMEGRLLPWQAITLICRDISVALFGIYLALTRRLTKYEFRAIWCGNVTTILQFFVLASLTLNIHVPSSLYITFILLGMLSLIELALPKKKLL